MLLMAGALNNRSMGPEPDIEWGNKYGTCIGYTNITDLNRYGISI